MKKLSILLFVTAAAAILFSSCNKEYAEPTITWTPDTLSSFVTVGDETTYNKTLEITTHAEAGINSIEVVKDVYIGTDVTSVTLDAPTGFAEQLDFTWTLTTNNVESDFGGGVTKIVYQVAVTDASEEAQTTTKDYTFFVDESYAVTIIVEDEEGTLIDDATVTFDGNEDTESPYVFDYVIESGTYEYTVEKTGYQTVNVTDFVMPTADTSFTVVLVKELSAWSSDVMISLLDGAYYNGIAVPDHENTTIGFKYETNTADAAVVVTTTNCIGWVEVDNVDYTTVAQIEAAYEDGTLVTTADLAFDYEAKTYAERFFISKVDGEYLLINYVAGLTCPNDHTATTGNKGNVLVFQYKN